MNNPRSILLIALLLVSYLIWNQWQQDYARPVAIGAPETSVPAAPGTAPPAAVASDEVPSANATPQTPTTGDTPAAVVPGAANEGKGDLVEVSNDMLKLWIDTRGATIVRADLLA